jgi:hypothetical protein
MTSTHSASQTISLVGALVADDAWHSFTVKRTTQKHGDITFTPYGFGAGHLSIRLRNALSSQHEVFSDEVTWEQGDFSTKTVATDVVAGTQYTVDAKLGPPVKENFTGDLVTG